MLSKAAIRRSSKSDTLSNGSDMYLLDRGQSLEDELSSMGPFEALYLQVAIADSHYFVHNSLLSHLIFCCASAGLLVVQKPESLPWRTRTRNIVRGLKCVTVPLQSRRAELGPSKIRRQTWTQEC